LHEKNIISCLRSYFLSSHVKQHTHPCYWSRRKCWFRRSKCRQTSSRVRPSSQSACTPLRLVISSVERNGSRTCSSRPHKWCGRSKSIARLQADVFWHEYLATIFSSYSYCSSRSKPTCFLFPTIVMAGLGFQPRFLICIRLSNTSYTGSFPDSSLNTALFSRN